MKIGIPKEVQADEKRVALIPRLLPLLIKDRHEVLVEAGAGSRASSTDAQYLQAGAILIEDASALYEKVPPLLHTPLMSTTNAISGISLVGSLVAAGSGKTVVSTILGTLAVTAATINVVDGFMITDRMLKMFRRKEGKAK